MSRPTIEEATAQRFRASPSVRTCELETVMVIVPVRDGIGDLDRSVVLEDESARLVWSRLRHGATIEELSSELLEAFDVDEVVARADVEAFVVQLNEIGIIEAMRC